MKPFIQDTERVLNSTNDLLKTGVYAENLVKVIENTPKDKAFTIGVFGGWGTGKSSIIKTAQEYIENKHKDIKFITYDAWKYANDSFRRMFLLKVQQELNMQPTSEMDRFYQSEIAEAEPKTKLSAKGLVIMVGVIIIISIILFLIPKVGFEWKVAVPTIGTLGSFLIALLNGCFYELKLSYSKPALFAPEQFEACFKEMMYKCLKRRNWFQKTVCAIREYVEIGKVSVVGLEKLIIVIDNIDRCSSEMAYQLLTDIKTFLSNEEYNLVFIVPIDDEALKKHLFRRLNMEDVDKDKEEFLRKVFNVTLRIKPHQETELQHFAQEINKENKLGYSSDTLAIVAKEFADNPRRIIQLLNNLSSSLALYEDKFAKDYETAICAVLILQEEYPKYYSRATKDVSVISSFKPDSEEDLRLKSFMRIAGIVFKHTPLDALQRILTNTASIFRDLSNDVQTAVRTFDTNGIIEYVRSYPDRESTLVDFVFNSIRMDVKSDAKSQITQWIDLLGVLYSADIVKESSFSAIDDLLEQYYKDALLVTSEPDAICCLGSQMSSAGFSSLRSAIVSYLNSEKTKKDTHYNNVLRAYYKFFLSEKDCKDIATSLESYYNGREIDKDVPFTATQKTILFGDNFVRKQIESLPAIDSENRIVDIAWCINDNKVKAETLASLFDRFIQLFGNTRGKTKNDYLRLIDSVNRTLASIPSNTLKNELSRLYDLVFSERGVPNRAYPGYPQYDAKISILSEIEEKETTPVIDFCFNVLRVSGGSINVNPAISELLIKNKRTVFEKAILAHKSGVSIASLANILIDAVDYETEGDLAILELVFPLRNDKRTKLKDESIKNSIRSLVDRSTDKRIEAFINKLMKFDTYISECVSEYVASLDSKKINQLPSTISKYAITSFNRESADSYKDNADFLILVLKQGNATQKKEVVRLMKAKINNEEDLDNVVSVLDNLETEDQQVLKPLISELEGLKESENVGEEIKVRIAELVTRLSKSIKKQSAVSKVLGKS